LHQPADRLAHHILERRVWGKRGQRLSTQALLLSKDNRCLKKNCNMSCAKPRRAMATSQGYRRPVCALAPPSRGCTRAGGPPPSPSVLPPLALRRPPPAGGSPVRLLSVRPCTPTAFAVMAAQALFTQLDGAPLPGLRGDKRAHRRGAR
jgi:hypothetical protein